MCISFRIEEADQAASSHSRQEATASAPSCREPEVVGEADEEQEGLFKVTTRVFWSRGEGRQGMEETVQMLYVPESGDGTRTLKPQGI